MSARKVAAAERRQAEDNVRMHLKSCLDCYRWQKGINLQTRCTLGPQLVSYLSRMQEQEHLLAVPGEDEMIQDTLW